MPAALLLAGCAPSVRYIRAALPTTATPATVEPEMPPVFYTLTVEARDLGADVFLNDVLVESLEPAERATVSCGVNLWVVPGENRLRVRSRSGHGTLGTRQMIRVRLGRQQPETEAPAAVVVDLDLAPPHPETVFDEVRSFRADPAPPADLWLHAQPLVLDEATRAAGTGLARELERAFYRRDVDGATALLEWKIVDSARAGFREAALARAAQRETLENLFEDTGFIVDHFTPESLQFELCAGGRLLKISRPSGPVLQARLSQGGRFRLPILAANVAGTFRIVR